MSSVTEVEFSHFEGLSPDQQSRLSVLLDGYFVELEQGHRLNREQLVARAPDLAGPLAGYLESIEFLHDAGLVVQQHHERFDGSGYPDRLRGDEIPAEARLLCLHQCVEGATVGPQGYVFRKGDDVIRGQELPGTFAVVLAGHVHRHQILTRDLRGRDLPAPVLYAGSTERTSFAERGETKGFLRLEVEADGFLYNMVRNIVGTLVEVGRGAQPDDWVAGVLAARDRKAAGATAPPQGLFLVHVCYGADES